MRLCGAGCGDRVAEAGMANSCADGAIVIDSLPRNSGMVNIPVF
jgi:hypothetical protein